MNYNSVGIKDKTKIVDIPIFVSPTCEGGRVDWIITYYMLSSEDVYIYSLLIINYDVHTVE